GVINAPARLVVFFISFGVILGLLPSAQARPLHPVPRRAHDRTIIVRLGPDKVTVDYRLEVDEFTVVYEDLPAFSDQIDLTRLSKPDEFYEAFVQCYAPVLASNLVASLDGKPLTFSWGKPRYTLRDELGQKLGHLRCDFRFEGRILTDPALPALTQPGSPRPALTQPNSPRAPEPHDFRFRESNYELEEGRIRLSLRSLKGVTFQKKVEPNMELQETPPSELKSGDDAKLRTITATFVVSEVHAAPGAKRDGAIEHQSPERERRGELNPVAHAPGSEVRKEPSE